MVSFLEVQSARLAWYLVRQIPVLVSQDFIDMSDLGVMSALDLLPGLKVEEVKKGFCCEESQKDVNRVDINSEIFLEGHAVNLKRFDGAADDCRVMLENHEG